MLTGISGSKQVLRTAMILSRRSFTSTTPGLSAGGAEGAAEGGAESRAVSLIGRGTRLVLVSIVIAPWPATFHLRAPPPDHESAGPSRPVRFAGRASSSDPGPSVLTILRRQMPGLHEP